jgi:ATP-dependent RNA circularization protein (DNA/RNA ligase family)
MEVIEYTKIPNIFKRETFGKNKLIEGEYSSPELEYLSESMWGFEEKIDGTNTRILWDGYRVSFMGRTDRAQIPAHLMAKLVELFGGETKEELFEQTFGKTEVILFGEGFGEKIQKGGGLYGPVNFRLFDVYINGFWLDRENVYDIAAKFGIDNAPFLFTGTLEDGVAFIKTHPQSRLRDAEMEGIVGRPLVQMFSRTGERIMVKIKCRDF